jgi:hypothetical protein
MKWMNCTILMLMMTVPGFAWAQHKNSPAPRPSAPAPHASAPAHNSAPSRQSAPNRSASPAQHSNTPNRTMGGGNSGRTGNNTMGGGNNGRTGNNTMGRSGTANGQHTGNNPTGRPGTTNGRNGNAHTNTMGKTNTGNAGRNGAGNTNRPGANNGHPGGANNGRAGTMNANKGGAGGRGGNRTPPGRQVSLKGGGSAHIRPNGQIRSVNRNGMQIQHGMHGGRTVVSNHNGARVVTTGRHGGYVQRNYVSRNGHTYVSRTYVVNNVSYTSVYRSYGYGGYCCYYGYAPAYYYNPGYYGWAYNPWPAPAPYAWGWGGAPWYGYYGAYFTPYPVYPSAAFWLTDYLVAASLRAAYEAQADPNAYLEPLGPDLPLVASMGPIPAAENTNVALSPEVKNLLAEEIKAQLAADEAEAKAKKSGGAATGGDKASNDGPPPALDPKRRTFVVNDEISLVVDGDECSLTAGDVISRVSDKPDDDKNVDVKVLASKKTDCAVGKQGAVAVEDLQEMHNHFREQLTGGMDELSKKQGKGGLPKAPDTGKVDGEVPAPPADSSAAKALKDQQAAADQTEADVKQEAGSSGGGVQ